MRGKQAKILSDDHLEDVLLFAETSRHPLRNKVAVLLSAKAGLRAGEIAHFTWDYGDRPNRRHRQVLELPDHAAKKGSGRVDPDCMTICEPLWPRGALQPFRLARGSCRSGAGQ